MYLLRFSIWFLSLFFTLFFLIGCDKSSITKVDDFGRDQLIYSFDSTSLSDLDVHGLLPENIVCLAYDHKVFYSNNSGKSFNVLSPDLGTTFIKFDDYNNQNILFLGTNAATVFIIKDFNQILKEVIYPDIIRINRIHIPQFDTNIYVAKEGEFLISFNDLFWINRYNFNWGFIRSIHDTIFELTKTQMGRIFDISSTVYSGKYLVFVSEKTLGGIISTNDNFKTYNFYHHNPKIYFVRHSLSKYGFLGIALIKNNLDEKGILVLTNDQFKTFTPLNNELINDLTITDFEIIDENDFILSGIQSEKKLSYLILIKDKGTSFIKLIEKDGEINSIDYTPLDRCIYYLRTINEKTEIYKYSLK